MSGSLEQAVAQWLKNEPHDEWCAESSGGECVCDREQRIAARVAAAIQAGIRGNKDGLLADGEFCVDCLASAEAEALRALTTEEP